MLLFFRYPRSMQLLRGILNSRSARIILKRGCSAKIQEVLTKDFMVSQLTKTRNHLTPEIDLYLITSSCPLYHCPTPQNAILQDPWWSIYWPGGQVLARMIIDNAQCVKKKNVLDLGSGCGAVSIAAKMSGAKTVIANDIDPNAAFAAAVNAKLNSVDIVTDTTNLLDGNIDILKDIDILFIGDMFYDEHIGGAVLDLCQKFKALDSKRKEIYMGDPGRWFLEDNQDVSCLFRGVAKYVLGEECRKENFGFRQGMVWKFK